MSAEEEAMGKETEVLCQTPITQSQPDPFKDDQTSDLPSKYTRENTVAIVVGPEKERYFVHQGLLAMKSPFFATLFKKCWDGDKEEIELNSISSDGFEIALDWIYCGHLPARLKECSGSGSGPWDSVRNGYKAADVLMISKLHNELITNEAAMFSKHGFKWRFGRLQDLYDDDLCHTKYYDFVIKIAVERMMTTPEGSQKEWDEDMESIEGNAKVMADLLEAIRKWLQKPWHDFPKGDSDLSEFLIEIDDPKSDPLTL